MGTGRGRLWEIPLRGRGSIATQPLALGQAGALRFWLTAPAAAACSAGLQQEAAAAARVKSWLEDGSLAAA